MEAYASVFEEDTVADEVPADGVAEADLDELDRLVREWHKRKSSDTLNRIGDLAQDFVRVAVSRVANVCPSTLDREDLVQAGMVGLVSAVKRFDPKRGTPFKSWAYSRVKGAAQDAVRRASSTSRTRDVRFVPVDSIPEGILLGPSQEIDDLLPDEATMALRTGVERLPERQAYVVLLMINGLSVKRLASLLSISETQVQGDRDAALLRLRDWLTP